MSAEMIYDKIPKLKLKCTICGGEIQENGEQQEGEQSGESGGESKEDEDKKNKEGKGGGDMRGNLTAGI
jgi:hypothetical protein